MIELQYSLSFMFLFSVSPTIRSIGQYFIFIERICVQLCRATPNSIADACTRFGATERRASRNQNGIQNTVV